MVRVLFVCLGNICRSPMAEAVFIHQVHDAGLDGEIEVDSAGTGSWHVGQRPHEGTLAVLRRNGVAEASRARQIQVEDLQYFDFVVVMDDQNLAHVKKLGTGRAELFRLLDFVPEIEDKQIPDPYFTGGFDGVYEMVKRGAEELLTYIRAEQGI